MPDSSGGNPWRVAFDNGHEAIVIVQDEVFRVANAAAERVSGYPVDRLVGRRFLEIVHPEDQARATESYRRRLAGDLSEQSFLFRMFHADGSLRWIEAHSVPIEWEGRPALLGFFADVSVREADSAQLAQHSRMMERIAELSPQFIFVYDYERGRDVYINRSVPAALGFDAAQEAALAPYPFSRLCHPEDLTAVLDRDTRWAGVPDGGVDTFEFRLRAADGSWRCFRSLSTPFRRDAEGRVVQMLGISEDITDQRRAEADLRRSERLAQLAVVTSGLAHDFGNLLTPILGRAELLLAQLPSDSELRVHAAAIRSAAGRAAELLDDLLASAGHRTVELRTVDLGELTREIVDLLRPTLPAGVALELALTPGLPPIAGDAGQLRQVLLNLLTNALDAIGGRVADIGQRGLVRVATARRRLDAATLATFAPALHLTGDEAIELSVRDNGVGMDEATRARLAEPFFTTKPRGRGLGLASAFGILRAHGAALAIDSAPDQGATFRVLFPLAASRPPG
jgi:PAS domain S-box-containing protein